jgi:hypothetical protein
LKSLASISGSKSKQLFARLCLARFAIGHLRSCRRCVAHSCVWKLADYAPLWGISVTWDRLCSLSCCPSEELEEESEHRRAEASSEASTKPIFRGRHSSIRPVPETGVAISCGMPSACSGPRLLVLFPNVRANHSIRRGEGQGEVRAFRGWATGYWGSIHERIDIEIYFCRHEHVAGAYPA